MIERVGQERGKRDNRTDREKEERKHLSLETTDLRHVNPHELPVKVENYNNIIYIHHIIIMTNARDGGVGDGAGYVEFWRGTRRRRNAGHRINTGGGQDVKKAAAVEATWAASAAEDILYLVTWQRRGRRRAAHQHHLDRSRPSTKVVCGSHGGGGGGSASPAN